MTGSLKRSWTLCFRSQQGLFVDEYLITEINEEEQNIILRIGKQGSEYYMECDICPDHLFLNASIHEPIIASRVTWKDYIFSALKKNSSLLYLKNKNVVHQNTLGWEEEGISF